MSDPQLRAWRLMLTAHAEVVDILAGELEEATGLPLPWYEVLLYLHESPDGRLRMHTLAESLLLSRSAATRFIDRMETAGLVGRETCATDRRGTFVVMTEAGRDAFDRAAPLHLAGIERHFGRRITDAEAAAMAGAFERVLAAIADPD